MRIAHFVERADSPGWATVLDNLCRQLRALGHESVVVSLQEQRPAFEPLPHARLYRVGLPVGRRFSLYPFLNFFFSLARCVRILWKEDIDVVHCHSMGEDRTGVLPLLLVLARRSVLTVHGVGFREGTCGESWKKFLFRLLLSAADDVTAVSAFARTEIRARGVSGSRKILRIPNGVDLDRFRPSDPAGIHPRPYLLSVAAIYPWKGLDLLGLAFRDVLDSGYDLDWLILGQDRTQGHFGIFLKSLGLNGRAHILGQVDHNLIPLYLSGCIVFAAPARYEAFGMAVLEAMAAGRPVVAAGVGGIPEYLTHSKDGYLVPPQDAAALRNALVYLLENPQARRRLGKQARLTAEKWTWRKSARAYAQVYAAAAQTA